ncbi:MAG: hypothetical protein IT161_03470 [Bryobacterales bacterium]|nr:hypothetical protein [Bryobacterales bacterium]
MSRRWLLCLALLPCAAQDVIQDWIREIEQSGGGQVLIARAGYDAEANEIRLAPGTTRPELFAEYLHQLAFVRELMAAQALTVSRQTPEEGPLHLILINTARIAGRRDVEEAVIGHELGHAWLRTLGYPAVAAGNSVANCLAIHATDAVQHILIRKELRRRGIDAETPWIATLNDALDQWKVRPLPAALTPCERIQTASQWVDVRLGLDEARWPRITGYEAQLKTRYPDIEQAVSGLAAYLAGQDVAEKEVNRRALLEAVRRLRALAPPTTPLKTNQ